MKRIITGVFVFIFIFILTGCTKDYKAITYTRFNEVFKENNNYLIVNQTLKYEDRFERCIEASGKNIQFIFYEFKTDEEARTYMKDNYYKRRKYRYRDKKNYITVKNTDNMYFYAIQIDKTVIVGNSPIKGNSKEIKSIFNKLGY